MSEFIFSYSLFRFHFIFIVSVALTYCVIVDEERRVIITVMLFLTGNFFSLLYH